MVLTQARRWASRIMSPLPEMRGVRVAVVLVGVAALVVYVLPGLSAPAAHWPLWDVRVYWWGGQQAAAGGGALYAPGAPFNFTYPPFAAMLFGLGAGAPVGAMKIALTAGSLVALPVLCGQALATSGVRRRPEIIFAVSALALHTWPVAYTLHLGEINLILAALIGTDLLWRRDGAWWQGIATGLAAGVKLTPLIFVAYLLLTGRVRAAVTAVATFAVTIAAGFIWLPAQSRTFWLSGVFYNQSRIGNPANPSDQSLSGAVARLAGTGDPPRLWWLVAVLTAGLAGLAVAVWAHRRGYRMAGFLCCAVTGLLVSPISWTHHWVWAVPLLVWLTVAAWRRRSAACALVAATAAAIFSGFTPLPWPGHSADAGLMAASDLYVLFGLAVLAATGVTLARGRGLALAAPGPAALASPGAGPGGGPGPGPAEGSGAPRDAGGPLGSSPDCEHDGSGGSGSGGSGSGGSGGSGSGGEKPAR
jgi:alpha-1,2-mannosyltransferase